MKQCSKCKLEKPLTDFGFDKRTDNQRSYCKACDSLYLKAWRKSPAGIKHLKNRHKTKSWQENNQKYLLSEKGKKLIKKRAKIQRKSGKYAAMQAVYQARINGIIFRKKICAGCFQENIRTHFHHLKGYNKENWLDVVELCAQCHKEAHMEVDHPYHPQIS